MKKALIFTATIGGGHNEVAACLEKEFIKKGFTVKKIDILSAISKNLDALVSSSCKILINKFPKIYGNIYDVSNRERANELLDTTILKISKKKVYNMIEEEKPDLIIATHCFAITAVGYLKEQGLIDIPFVSIVTDYKAHLSYINKNVDAYITGSNYTVGTLEVKGVTRDKIFPYGIPIKREFSNSHKEIGEGKKPFQILLMAGSLGLASMERILNAIVDIDRNYHIVAVCGNDKKLKKTIEKKHSNLIEQNKVTLYGYTNNIPEIMEESDVIITKPGGLTVTEAIAKSLPIVIPYYIPGQEEENLEFLVSSGVAIYEYEIKDIKKLIEAIIENPKILDSLKENMRGMYNQSCLNNIMDLSENLIKDYNYEMDMIYEEA